MMHLHDVERMLADAGYSYARSRGGHHVYRNARGAILVIAAHGKHTFSAAEVEQLRREIRNRAHDTR